MLKIAVGVLGLVALWFVIRLLFMKGLIGGDNLSPEEFERLETPLRDVDGVLEHFATEHNLTLTKNSKSWPERSLRWSGDGIDKLIQIYVRDPKAGTFNFWICATQDRKGERFWRQKNLRENVQWKEINFELDRLLTQGFSQMSNVKQNELEPARSISSS